MKYVELLQSIRKINDKIDEQYGEILEEDQSELEAVENDLEWWVNHLIIKAKEDKSNAAAAKELAAHYTERAKSFERKEAYRKLGIYTLVEMHGSAIKTVSGNARIQEGMESLVINCPDELLPDEFKKVEYRADKEAIKKALKDGKELNYASIQRGKPFLVIR